MNSTALCWALAASQYVLVLLATEIVVQSLQAGDSVFRYLRLKDLDQLELPSALQLKPLQGWRQCTTQFWAYDCVAAVATR